MYIQNICINLHIHIHIVGIQISPEAATPSSLQVRWWLPEPPATANDDGSFPRKHVSHRQGPNEWSGLARIIQESIIVNAYIPSILNKETFLNTQKHPVTVDNINNTMLKIYCNILVGLHLKIW